MAVNNIKVENAFKKAMKALSPTLPILTLQHSP